MNENASLAVTVEGELSARWRTPGYQVVETSLEITMYVSATR